MKLTTIAILLLLSSNCFSQQTMPDSFCIKLYYGGDYRSEKYGSGATDFVDSLSYIFNKDENLYISKKIYQTQKIFIYLDEEFNTTNINTDSTITLFDKSVAKQEELESLIFWSNSENYILRILKEEIHLDSNSVLSYQDTVLVPENISIEDFGITIDKLREDCKFYNLNNDDNKDCLKIDADYLISKVFTENIGFKSVSSYLHYIEVSCYVSGENIRLIQTYPGELNIKWKVVSKSKGTQLIINPYLNEIVSNLLPSSLRNKAKLNEFKDKGVLLKSLH